MRAARLLPVLIAVVLCVLAPRAAESAPCRSETFEDAGYTVCSFDLTKADLRLFWRKPEGAPYATFSALADQLAGQGRTLQFAMNGGMYGDDLSPIGLYVENGSRDARGQHGHGDGRAGANPEFLQEAERRIFRPWRRSRRDEHGGLRERAAGGGFCDAVGADAGHRRRHPPGLHRRTPPTASSATASA